jgi:ABC-type molybdate transport system, ATPase component
MLRVDVEKQLGEFALAAAFTSEGRVTGLFGASGAGKTSLINMIAGCCGPTAASSRSTARRSTTPRRMCTCRRTGGASAMCSRTRGCFRISTSAKTSTTGGA